MRTAIGSLFIKLTQLLYFLSLSSATASLALTHSPQMLNAQDVSLNVQAAVKNLASNTVFYFVIPISFDALLALPSPPMDVQRLVAAWKSMDETSEAAVVVNGTRL